MKICNIPQQIFDRIDRIQVCKIQDFTYDLSKDLSKELPNVDSEESKEKSLMIRCLPEDLNLSNTSRTNVNGVYWNISIDMKIADKQVVDAVELEKFQNVRCFVVLHAVNHKIVFGNSDQFLKFSYSEKNSQKPQSGNYFTIKLKGISLHNDHVVEN